MSHASDGDAMTHTNEEQLVSAYYETDPATRAHLDECPECRAAFELLKEHLDVIRDYPAPARSASYGREVWTRLLPHLPPARRPRPWLRWWTLAPAFATLLAIAFVAGMLTQRRAPVTGTPETARERLVLMAMSRHLERSQIVLAEIENGSAATIDFRAERDRARDLLNDNRLLRQAALRGGDAADATLLDELERILLDIANSPAEMAPADLADLQSRIDNESLLFKVRITTSDLHFRGQKL
jgi:hypothetical protein